MSSRVARREQDGRERHEGGTRQRSADDTRRSWRYPADTRDRAALRRSRCAGHAVKAGLAHPRRDSDRGCAGCGRPRHGDSFVRVVARRRRGPPGTDRPPRRRGTTRSPRCAWSAGAGRGNGAGRSEGGNWSDGHARSRAPDRCSRPGRCNRSDRSERHGRRELNDFRNSGAFGDRRACRHERYCHGDMPSGPVCTRRWCAGLGAGPLEQERHAAVLLPDEHQWMAGRGVGDRSARNGGTDDGAPLRPLRKGIPHLRKGRCNTSASLQSWPVGGAGVGAYVASVSVGSMRPTVPRNRFRAVGHRTIQ